MRIMSCFIAVVVVSGLVFSSLADEPKGGSAKGKPNPARLKGMKAALADIEKGSLKQKEFPLPDPAWFGVYMELLKKECGVEWEMVDQKDYKEGRAELDGYNDVMRVEIEHRYERGILDKLNTKTKEAWEKKK
jgi:hypothetical protein